MTLIDKHCKGCAFEEDCTEDDKDVAVAYDKDCFEEPEEDD